MARAPDARAEQAKKLFLSGKKLIEISKLMKIPEGTIRSWKNRYKWDNATLQNPKRNVAKKRGGQPGNRKMCIRDRCNRIGEDLEYIVEKEEP